MRAFLYLIYSFFLLIPMSHAALKVGSLHPLLSDMAHRVGGEQIEIADIFPRGSSLHSFDPSSTEMAKASGARLILAMGKQIENYLPKLRDSMPSDCQILELGRDVPDVMLPGSSQPDPHWWNTPQNMKRASRTLLAALIELNPAQRSAYETGQRQYARDMNALHNKSRIALSRIPQDQRVLVTGHAAMCHFCKSYNFISVPLFGIASEGEGDLASLAVLLQQLRRRELRCVFSEIRSQPKLLENIAAELNAACLPLSMDGLYSDGASYESSFDYNVSTIVKGLSNPPAAKQP